MAISYPLTFPTTSGVAHIELYADHAAAISSSPFTYQSQVQNYSGQRWGASVTIPPLPRDLAEQWVTFLLKLKGVYGTFLMGDPSGATPRGSLGGTPVVDGGGQTGGTLSIRGGSPSVSGYFRSGDYIQLGTGSSSRLHKVIGFFNTDAFGDIDINIWPDLRSSPADGATIYTSNTVGLFRLSDNRIRWDINEASFYGIQFDCVEAL